MYVIDEHLFTKATGVTYQSPQGLLFRQIAVRSLQKIEQDIPHSQELTKQLAHKVKGIALSCGMSDIARICSKVESYDRVINAKIAKNILSNKVKVMIQLCES
ncbi:Hpt domain-containing protein [Aliivibrio finisterrensis]|uniref:Hpt domain-containing protein n=1 Tax=Aliivibrio finisterrensis TaxID=511998 RepID=UPI001020518A|nr:Hpt domain-containing protein [Aliivibrio finisterrensis]RYU68420.1 Hpt domain-containing protein [Aliivibrio finisterrensis]RYU72172.1 Hpt domain-containing protein [Aliivibrio finisterrensis]RYU75688.1 Hpt domain-containing protein [Aliivibrio finisterrensis]